MGREYKEKLMFENDGTEYSAFDQAKKWLEENGYSYGTMQRNDEIGIMIGDVIISKWRNLSQKDRAELDGIMDCDITIGYRNGNVRIVIYKKNSDMEIEKARERDIEINSEYITIKSEVAEKLSNDFNRHIYILLEEQGKLGEFLGQGNDRTVFSCKDSEGFVIKIPNNQEAIQSNESEYSQYMTQRSMEQKASLTPKNPIAACFMVGDCLYMEKLDVHEGTDFGVDRNGKLKRFDLF